MVIIKIMANTKVILKILLPIAFAMEISGFPPTLAAILAAISGRLVPNAIMVAPMTNSEIFKRTATMFTWLT